jgi:hypothetical protein
MPTRKDCSALLKPIVTTGGMQVKLRWGNPTRLTAANKPAATALGAFTVESNETFAIRSRVKEHPAASLAYHAYVG